MMSMGNLKRAKIFLFILRLVGAALFWIPLFLAFHSWKERLLAFLWIFFLIWLACMSSALSRAIKMFENLEKD
jgi:hypothetical protein